MERIVCCFIEWTSSYAQYLSRPNQGTIYHMHNNSPDPSTIHSCILLAPHIPYWFAHSYDQETARNHMGGGCEDYSIPCFCAMLFSTFT